MCCASDNHNYMCHTCAKKNKFELQFSSYWQNTKFSRYCPKFHIFTNIVIFQVWQGHVRNTLFIFASCHPLSMCHRKIKFVCSQTRQISHHFISTGAVSFSKGNCTPNQNWVCTSCAFSWNEQYFLEKKCKHSWNKMFEKLKKMYWNISKSCGSWVIDENNIWHALINNSRTAGPT